MIDSPGIPSANETEEFFFEAALATYAGNAKKISVGRLIDFGLEGWQGFEYRRRLFCYRDVWASAPKEDGMLERRSWGNTFISYNGTVLWCMNYSGWSNPNDHNVLQVLKRGLRLAYTAKHFLGGRGVKTFCSADGYEYRNELSLQRGFLELERQGVPCDDYWSVCFWW